MIIGYHASHEQFTPSDLLEYVRQAEDAGFQAAFCSDHFHPWSRSQGQSGFAWAWLGAALHATNLSFGVATVPGYRYHPTIVAQASATLAQMFPGRFWVAVGSGELLNEGVVGTYWPIDYERNERLQECVDVIRSLWRGEKVSYSGYLLTEEARLFTRPAEPPLLVGTAITPDTARWLGSWADGLITISQPMDQLRKVVEAFREGGGEGKPMYLQVHLSYARDDREALQAAWEEWRFAVSPSAILAELRTPEKFEAAAGFITPEDMRGPVNVSSDLQKHIEWLLAYADLGFDAVYLHNVNRDQQRFIRDFGREVVPAVQRLAKPRMRVSSR